MTSLEGCNGAAYQCPVCDKMFQRKIYLQRHKQIHSDKRKFPCEFCKTRFRKEGPYRKHLLRHTAKGSKHMCKICSATFQVKRSLYAHTKRMHDTGNKRGNQCPFCEWNKVEKFDNHIRSHIQERPHFCKFCPYESPTITGLKVHLETHDPNRQKNFQCDLCSRKFLTKAYLLRHISTHLREKQFNCANCDKSFLSSYELKSHQKVHSLERSFRCKDCGKAFKCSFSLRSHMELHTSSPQYPCTICTRRFYQRGGLRNHIKRVHTNERAYKCGVCQMDFKTSSDMRRHQRVHTKEKLLCGLCKKAVETSTQLRIHMRGHHGGKVYDCKICGRELTNRVSLKRHIGNHAKNN